MNVRQTEVFRAVMTTGSVTGAARLLNVSQPAISRVLRHTEDNLGFLLFARHGGRLLPTPEAEALYGEADQALKGMQRVSDLASSLARGTGRTLRIAANPSFGAVLLPRAASAFLRRHPETCLDILTISHPAVVDRVALRQADIGLTQFASSHPGLNSQRLGAFPCQVAVRSGSPLASLGEIPAAELARHPLISYEADTPIGDAILRYAEANGIALKPAITVRYPMIACMFVDEGLGIAIVDPFVALRSEQRWRFTLRPLAPPLLFETWLLTLTLRPLPHAGRAFTQILSGTLKDLTGSGAG